MPEWAVQLITSAGIAGVFSLYIWLHVRAQEKERLAEAEFRERQLQFIQHLIEEFNTSLANHMHHETSAIEENTRMLMELSVLIRRMCEEFGIRKT